MCVIETLDTQYFSLPDGLAAFARKRSITPAEISTFISDACFVIKSNETLAFLRAQDYRFRVTFLHRYRFFALAREFDHASRLQSIG
jgi:hypothetical protein